MRLKASMSNVSLMCQRAITHSTNQKKKATTIFAYLSDENHVNHKWGMYNNPRKSTSHICAIPQKN